ncbi:hypothetical protein K461DRAFT_125631 [Myriangium duriaei CBS 260.36]|uniref:Zn(2)-C6 fungal-type domain-containing protein n=1 Tax=Myriangium duriaei CBS 260.36 TaxID=1168546 RepID=A0A9P4J6B9_9PEZI|nr:hypothetical protein K461DRAFT_125631 [Myriangium duriaei CBS 260.36]
MATNTMPSANERQDQSEHHRRAYQACTLCRKRKSRCDFGDRDGPPCVRCRREMRECTFAEHRSSRQRTEDTQSPDDPQRPSKRFRRSTASTYDHDYIAPRMQRISQRADRDGKTPPFEEVSESQKDANNASEDQRSNPDLASSVMRTVVSSGNDALNLLYQAAHTQREPSTNPDSEPTPPLAHTISAQHDHAMSAGTPGHQIDIFPMIKLNEDTFRLWNACRFVRMGWFSAEEAATYIDLFYRNMSGLTPISTELCRDHRNHHSLVVEEPLLCCTILLISSRYHSLTGAHGGSRTTYIHDRMWKHCQHLLLRLMLGQEKLSSARTRTLGSVEALILLSEWHPRALHFPPESDGWDSDLLLSANVIPFEERNSIKKRWAENVIEPARRSDRMTWMLLGLALSLAHELNVFSEEATSSQPQLSPQRTRIECLLYTYINQSSLSQGSTSTLPTLRSAASPRLSDPAGVSSHSESYIRAWTELTKLLKSFCDIMLPSKTAMEQILRSGRYQSIWDHFCPLFASWRDKWIQSSATSGLLQDLLVIEYAYSQIYCNSVGMQAVCERMDRETDSTLHPQHLASSIDDVDQTFIQKVIAHSCELLDKAVELHEKGSLRFAPVRVYLRVTTASVFLLKALGLGARSSDLRRALNMLKRTIAAFKASVIDDTHLANDYAMLLQTYIGRLQRVFLASSKKAYPTRPTSPHNPDSRPSQHANSSNHRNDDDLTILTNQDDLTQMAGGTLSDPMFDMFSQQFSPSDWFSLPFDPTMAPLCPSGDPDPSLYFPQEDMLNFS